MISSFTTQYLPPLLVAVVIGLAAVLLVYLLSRRGEGVALRIWRGLAKYRWTLVFFGGVVLFVVAFSTFLVRHGEIESLRKWQDNRVSTESNLLVSYPADIAPGSPELSATWSYKGGAVFNDLYSANLAQGASIRSHDIVVRPGANYRYS